jgi:hypothetical protein
MKAAFFCYAIEFGKAGVLVGIMGTFERMWNALISEKRRQVSRFVVFQNDVVELIARMVFEDGFFNSARSVWIYRKATFFWTESTRVSFIAG